MRRDADFDDFEQLSSKLARSGPSLKARAIALLSRREYSRVELARKLAPYVDEDMPAELDTLLDELQREHWQSDERFLQAVVNRRAPRKGSALIVQELKRHGLDDSAIADARDQLKHTELERAREVWAKKFGRPPADAKAYVKQFRFLASRGFSSDCLRKILESCE